MKKRFILILIGITPILLLSGCCTPMAVIPAQVIEQQPVQKIKYVLIQKAKTAPRCNCNTNSYIAW